MSKQANLTTKESRAKLAVRAEPHWCRIAKGAYLGFYRGVRGDAWRARFAMPDGKQLRCPTPELADAPDFDAARAIAETWFKTLGGSGVRTVRRGTVREAFAAAVEQLRELRKEHAANDAARYLRTLFGDDPLGAMAFESVTRDDVNEWRARIAAGKRGAPLSAQTLNDYLRRTRTAVRRAIRAGYAGNLAAWDVEYMETPPEQPKGDFLTAEQRDGIIAHATTKAHERFLRALNLTGARPIEIARATVADYDRARGTLKLFAKKRSRLVVLGPKGRALCEEAAADRIGLALLFPNPLADEGAWTRGIWARNFREAVAAYRASGGSIPRSARCYSFRHAHISEALQLHGINPVIVAQQHGTSVAIIEKHYLRVMPEILVAQLAAVG